MQKYTDIIWLNWQWFPTFTIGDHHDVWWNYDVQSDKYHLLLKVVKAVPSILTEPQAEASFSLMNDIIDKRSCHI